MKEKDIERKLGADLRRVGCLYYKFVSPGTDGVPDRIVVTPWGETIYVELKTEKGRLSELQTIQIGRLMKHRARVYVLYGTRQTRDFVSMIIREASEHE